MLIEINLETCLENELSVNQFTILYLLFKKQYGYLESFFVESDIQVLKARGFIIEYENSYTFEEISLNFTKLETFFNYKESFFSELLVNYPLKVYNGISIRYLRPADSEAKKAKDLRKKYESIIKTKAHHDLVIKCLLLEVETRKRSNNLYYMQNLDTWINQRSWEQYKHLLNEEKERSIEDAFGQTVI